MRWHVQDALVRYRERRSHDPRDMKAVLGCMKCLDALGEWDELVYMCHQDWGNLTSLGLESAVCTKAATLAAR